MSILALTLTQRMGVKSVVTSGNCSCGKVMFSHACVKNSVHGGVCMAGGVCMTGGGMCGRGRV